MIKSLNHMLNCNIVSKQMLRTTIATKQDTSGWKRSLSTDNQVYVDRHFRDIDLSTFASLVSDNNTKEKIKCILVEYEYEKWRTFSVPKTLNVDNMRQLLSAYGYRQRKRILHKLCNRELIDIESDILKMESKAKALSEKKKKDWSLVNAPTNGLYDNDGEVIYGLWHNSMFTRINAKHVKRLMNNRLRHSSMFAQKIVIDLDFERYLTLSESNLLAKNISDLYRYNKYKTVEPFDLHFANCDMNSPTFKELIKQFPSIESNHHLIQLHDKSYHELFPFSEFIYLTPHAKQSIEDINENIVYIIGGLLESQNNSLLEYNKAKSEGIKALKIPVEYLSNTYACVSFNDAVAILHDIIFD